MSGDWNVLVTEPIDEAGLAKLEAFADVTRWNEYEADANGSDDDARLPADIDRYHAIVVRTSPLDAAAIARADELRVVSKHGVGVDNIDLEAASERNVPVGNLPGVNTQEVAEHALALLVGVRKTLLPTNEALESGSWDRSACRSRTVKGDTLGLFGYGHAGQTLAEMANGLGLSCVAYDPYVTDAELPLHVTGVETKRKLFETADCVSVHTPLTPETRGAIGREELRALPDTGVIVNTARGGIIDEEALEAALENDELAGAGLDVFVDEPPAPDHPLVNRSDVIATPHIAGTTVEALRRMSLGAAETVRRVHDGKLPTSTVNESSLER
ncbi:Phosphoglycerate dehydrogenase [Natronorubrum sediminis]|uniref:Phosphoglycerate dehydrogenase n=1 Tax=Natronorubrum sediminis TaxID=640943 RepID=A0A1H6FUE4_9EURY|nr:hydroxyacid dehydrogenase [Natronorubrum sediminis]SEH13464.1 Phosphoglycerate dehydrogenase [Natronorubrum sediminis]